mgnify:CR=1 FL=1
MGRINWEKCKEDIRDKLLSVASLDSILIQLFALIAFLKTVGNDLSSSILIGITIFIIGALISVLWVIVVHWIFPAKNSI